MEKSVAEAVGALIALGAEQRVYTYAAADGSAQKVGAYVYNDFGNNDLFQEFSQEHWPQLKEEAVTLFKELFMQQVSREKLLRSNQPARNPSMENIWLFLDRSIEMQLSLLDAFGYGQGAGAEVQTSECKKLLCEIYQTMPFNVFLVSKNTVGIAFVAKPSTKTVEPFFDLLIEFMKRYKRLQFSPGALRKEIIRSSDLVL